MKIALERHAYAPELNRAHVIRGGRIVASLPAPGCVSIREARAKLFPVGKAGRLIVARYERAAPWHGLNREYRALYPLGGEALRKAVADSRKLAERHAGGILGNGERLPDATRRVHSALRG